MLTIIKGYEAGFDDPHPLNGYTPLQIAIQNGHTDIACLLIEKYDCRPGKTNREMMNALHFAAKFIQWGDATKLFKLVRDRNLDLTEQNSNKDTALNIASKCGNVVMATEILTFSPESAGIPDAKGSLAWHNAASVGDMVMINLLCDGDLNKYNVPDVFGNTGLHYAVRSENIACTGAYLEIVDINKRNVQQETPLMAACQFGRLEMVKLLLQRGADMDLLDASGASALMHALKKGQSDVATTLVEGGADAILGQDKVTGYTNIHLAIDAGLNEFAISLLSLQGINTLLSTRSKKGQTPLMLAIRSGQLQTIHEILKVSPSAIDEKDDKGLSCLHFAVISGSLATFEEILLQTPETLRVAAMKDSDLMEYAAKYGKIDIISRLLELSASVDGFRKSNTTPLLEAIQYGQYRAMDLLLRSGATADLDWVPSWKKMHLEQSLKRPRIFERLLFTCKSLPDIPLHRSPGCASKIPLHLWQSNNAWMRSYQGDIVHTSKDMTQIQHQYVIDIAKYMLNMSEDGSSSAQAQLLQRAEVANTLSQVLLEIGTDDSIEYAIKTSIEALNLQCQAKDHIRCSLCLQTISFPPTHIHVCKICDSVILCGSCYSNYHEWTEIRSIIDAIGDKLAPLRSITSNNIWIAPALAVVVFIMQGADDPNGEDEQFGYALADVFAPLNDIYEMLLIVERSSFSSQFRRELFPGISFLKLLYDLASGEYNSDRDVPALLKAFEEYHKYPEGKQNTRLYCRGHSFIRVDFGSNVPESGEEVSSFGPQDGFHQSLLPALLETYGKQKYMTSEPAASEEKAISRAIPPLEQLLIASPSTSAQNETETASLSSQNMDEESFGIDLKNGYKSLSKVKALVLENMWKTMLETEIDIYEIVFGPLPEFSTEVLTSGEDLEVLVFLIASEMVWQFSQILLVGFSSSSVSDWLEPDPNCQRLSEPSSHSQDEVADNSKEVPYFCTYIKESTPLEDLSRFISNVHDHIKSSPKPVAKKPNDEKLCIHQKMRQLYSQFFYASPAELYDLNNPILFRALHGDISMEELRAMLVDID